MVSQFYHVDTIARQSPRKATVRQWSVREIAAEAARSAASCRHVAVPRPPVRLFGAAPEDLPCVVDQRVYGATDAKGRKLRRDAKVLLAGVASFPVPLDSVKRSHIAAERYRAWAQQAVEWLRKEYGRALVSIICHHDENYPHLHFYAVPNFRAGQTMADLHPGMRAIANTTGGKGQKDRAYKAAMRSLQERYWNDVGRHFDHARISAQPRRRWTFWEWKEITRRTRDLESRLARITKAYARLTAWTSAMTPTCMVDTLFSRSRERPR